ncbi:MAG: hypothetical protein NVSMB27_33030 [Ktedonobacteraceae bacterium]
MWLEKAANAGFTDLVVVRRQPMTVQRLMHYPIYQAGLLEDLFALVEPSQRDHLVASALISARAGEVSTPVEQASTCFLSVPPS